MISRERFNSTWRDMPLEPHSMHIVVWLTLTSFLKTLTPEMYVWNRYLVSPFIESCKESVDSAAEWVLHIIHGYFEQMSTTSNTLKKLGRMTNVLRNGCLRREHCRDIDLSALLSLCWYQVPQAWSFVVRIRCKRCRNRTNFLWPWRSTVPQRTLYLLRSSSWKYSFILDTG